jgi:hypothetical protein
MAKYKIPTDRVFKDFALVKTLTGTYVCPGWIPVENGTTRGDVEYSDDLICENTITQTQLKIKKTSLEFKALSSNGKSEYLITLKNEVWDCTCPAKMFRRGDCKHIKNIKENNYS